MAVFTFETWWRLIPPGYRNGIGIWTCKFLNLFNRNIDWISKCIYSTIVFCEIKSSWYGTLSEWTILVPIKTISVAYMIIDIQSEPFIVKLWHFTFHLALYQSFHYILLCFYNFWYYNYDQFLHLSSFLLWHLLNPYVLMNPIWPTYTHSSFVMMQSRQRIFYLRALWRRLQGSLGQTKKERGPIFRRGVPVGQRFVSESL